MGVGVGVGCARAEVSSARLEIVAVARRRSAVGMWCIFDNLELDWVCIGVGFTRGRRGFGG